MGLICLIINTKANNLVRRDLKIYLNLRWEMWDFLWEESLLKGFQSILGIGQQIN